MANEQKAPQPTPFDTLIQPLGTRGVQLTNPIDRLAPGEAVILQNLVTTGGSLDVRPGQTALLLTAGGAHHSLARLNRPQDTTYARFVGRGTELLRALNASTSPLQVATGFSGDPLTFVAYRPPLSGESYLFVADRSKMGKITTTGSFLPIGLPPPAAPVVSSLNSILTTRLAAFDSSDSSEASNWTATLGQDAAGHASVTATATDVSGVSGSAVEFLSEGAPTTGDPTETPYTCIFGTNRTLDLTRLQGGAFPAADADLMHLWINVDHPAGLAELRIYIVVGPTFDRTKIPGQDDTANLDAYWKVITPNEFSPVVEGLVEDNTTVITPTNPNWRTLVDPNQPMDLNVYDPRDGSYQTVRAQRAGKNYVSSRLVAGRGVWTEFGVVGVPLRRSDFARIGSTPNVGWANVSGIVIVAAVYPPLVAGQSVRVRCDDWFLTGGYGLDTTEPGMIRCDFRYTHYDTRTGAEGNPSPIQAATDFLDFKRQAANLQPVPYGDSHIRQRFYRRGGSLTDNWYFDGQNTSDGALYVASLSDQTIQTAGTVAIDHDQPVSSLDSSLNTVSAQPVPILLGPVNDLLIGFGDPNRPGEVYWSQTGAPDHWPAANHTGVCSPSEELMNGAIWAGQAYTFSRERLYALYVNLTAQQTITPVPTQCAEGLCARWGMCVGPDGLYFIALDGIRKTTGGPSQLIHQGLRPLFHGQTVEGHLPIDFTDRTSLRLAYADGDLWFLFKDTGGTHRSWIYSITYDYWRQATFADPPICVYNEPVQAASGGTSVLLGGGGITHRYSGTSDNLTAIACRIRTGAWDFGRPREDKLLGDVVLEANFGGAGGTVVSLTTLLNAEAVTNTTQTVASLLGRQRYLFDPFGVTAQGPQKARNVTLDLSWSSPVTLGQGGNVYGAGVSAIPQPDTIINRPTDWETLSPGGTEGYLIGCRIDCDTFGAARHLLIECELAGVITTAATLTVNPTGLLGRHTWFFSWPVAKAMQVRVRPSSADICLAWQLYRCDWLSQPEPPRIAGWDTNWEDAGDSYYTGFDIECDTFGQPKTVQVWIDQTLIDTKTVTASGRRHLHFTLTPGRGHVYRLVATDANNGLLYTVKWYRDTEPSEQTNWNQNYTVAGTLTDKWVKGLVLECDTFGATKTVQVECNGVPIAGSPFSVVATGRSVVQLSWPKALGRVLRLIPTDAFPGRLYSSQWIFDEEPLNLTYWETQELDHGIDQWHYPYDAMLTIKSTTAVILTLTGTDHSGVASVTTYTIPATASVKQKVYLPFSAQKGVLWRYQFVAQAGGTFLLYREESHVRVQALAGGNLRITHPFGNDDLDLVRGMQKASLTAARGGGGERPNG